MSLKEEDARSPRISECSTATNAGLRSIASPSTAVLPTTESSNDYISTTTAVSPSSSATNSSSAFSIIGETLTKFIHNFSGKPSSRRPLPPKFIQKRIIRRISASQSSTLRKPRKFPKWAFNCKGCTRPITFTDVKADNAIYALKGVWHRSHLVCFKCAVPIGDERRPFIADGKHAVCLDCHMENDHPSCAVCSHPLFETCIEVDDKLMHHQCFVCERCKAPFPGGKYCMYKDKPYDIDCYHLKAFENVLAAPLPTMVFDTISPPPIASGTDSPLSLPTTPIIEDLYKRKPAEVCSLADMAPTAAKKDFSSENAEADMAKAMTSKAAPLSLSAEGHISLGPDAGSKEKIENAVLSKESLIPPPSPPPVRSPIRENLEDFVNGKEEANNSKEDAKSPPPKPAEDKKTPVVASPSTESAKPSYAAVAQVHEAPKETAEVKKRPESPVVSDSDLIPVTKDTTKAAQTPEPPEALTLAIQNELLKTLSNSQAAPEVTATEPLKEVPKASETSKPTYAEVAHVHEPLKPVEAPKQSDIVPASGTAETNTKPVEETQKNEAKPDQAKEL